MGATCVKFQSGQARWVKRERERYRARERKGQREKGERASIRKAFDVPVFSTGN